MRCERSARSVCRSPAVGPWGGLRTPTAAGHGAATNPVGECPFKTLVLTPADRGPGVELRVTPQLDF